MGRFLVGCKQSGEDGEAKIREREEGERKPDTSVTTTEVGWLVGYPTLRHFHASS